MKKAMSNKQRQQLYRKRKKLAFWLYCDFCDLVYNEQPHDKWIHGHYVGESRPEKGE